MKTLALFSKPNDSHAWGVLNEILALAEAKGMTVLTGPRYGGWDGKNWDAQLIKEARERADIALAIGGDGTLLGVARALFGTGKPLLGVNLGTLGFLTDVGARDVKGMLDALLAGEYIIEPRILLEAQLCDSTGEPLPDSPAQLAFNDVVLTRAYQMSEFDVYVDGAPLFNLRADALIIATPTGTTAYSLSANGPILHPALAAVAVVPLAAHSLTARPLTLPSTACIEIRGIGPVCPRVMCDGQRHPARLRDGMRLRVSQAAETVPMLHLKTYNFFNTLREKLDWGNPRAR